MTSTVSIELVETKKQLGQFLDFPYTLYEKSPAWRAPLRFERAEQLNPDKNPGAPRARALFLAFESGEVVGRIAAFINLQHNQYHSDKAGFFGYLDCVKSDVVTEALLAKAESWLKGKGMDTIIGPSQWSVNEECGLLIKGYEHPPVVMMPFGRPDYKDYMTQNGFEKATDMFAFQAELEAGYPRSKFLQSLLTYSERNKSISWRPLKMKDYDVEVALVMDIFNDAWSENWGFIPYSEAQIEQIAKEMKPVIFENGLWVGYIDDVPAAFICMIPDINELTHGFDGKLLPFNWAKLLWRLKVKGAKQARIPLMGLRKSHQNTRKGLALVARLCEAVFGAGRNKGFTHCELSWILEDNTGMIGICEEAAAVNYKTYRMYSKAL